MDKDFSMSDEFKDLPPDQLASLFDNDEKQRFGGVFASSFSIRDDMNSFMSPRKPDCSMGSYFQPRSSLPFSSMLGNVTTPDRYPNDPPEQDRPVRQGKLSTVIEGRSVDGYDDRSKKSRMMDSEVFDNHIPKEKHTGLNKTGELDQSLSHLAKYFADPEKGPMSSTAIMNHVLDYCKSRKSSDAFRSRNSISVQEILETRKRTSELFRSMSSTSNATSQSQLRKSDSYDAFTKDFGRKGSSSRCSTPDSTNTSLGKTEKQSKAESNIKCLSKLEYEKKPRIESPVENKENTPAQWNENSDKVHLQLHLPPAMLGKHGSAEKPVVINIACPRPRPASCSNINDDVCATAVCVPNDGSSGRYSQASSVPGGNPVSTISIQLTGTIQFH